MTSFWKLWTLLKASHSQFSRQVNLNAFLTFLSNFSHQNSDEKHLFQVGHFEISLFKFFIFFRSLFTFPDMAQLSAFDLSNFSWIWWFELKPELFIRILSHVWPQIVTRCWQNDQIRPLLERFLPKIPNYSICLGSNFLKSNKNPSQH